MTVFTVVPSSVMTQGTMRVLTVLIGIYLFVAVVAVVLSIYFSKRFTSPIREISEEMTQFDGNDFSRLIELNTNTELDQIGHSYNKMLKNIENLLAEIKEQEGVLRRTELNMLLAQINPHFLYNTLGYNLHACADKRRRDDHEDDSGTFQISASVTQQGQ